MKIETRDTPSHAYQSQMIMAHDCGQNELNGKHDKEVTEWTRFRGWTDGQTWLTGVK